MRADAVHGGAQAAGIVEGNHLFAFGGKAARHAVHQVNLSADGEHLPRRSLVNESNQPLGGTESVGLLADLPAALGMNDDLNAGILGAHLIDVAGQKAQMDGAVALPEQDAAVCKALLRLAPLQAPRVPNHHFVQRNPHGVAGVAAQVLIGQKQYPLAAGKGPLKGRVSIGGGADQPAAFPAKGLDGGGGIHIGQRHGLIGQAEVLERLPTGFYLGDFGHIGHGAACVQVGQDDLLPRAAEHVGALGHEVHAAENNVFGVGFSGNPGELVAVARGVGKADYFVALIVVPEQERGRAQLGACRRNARVHGMVGKRQIIFKTATAASRLSDRHGIVKNQVHCIPPSVLLALWGQRTGMLKANMAAVDALTFPELTGVTPDASGKSPPTGLLQPFHIRRNPMPVDSRKIQPGKSRFQ